MKDDRENVTARREAIKALGGTLVLLGCGSSGSTATPGDGGASGCPVAAEETIGPYPDKTGMLTNPMYNRRDVTEGKAGLTLTLVLSVVNTKSACAAVPNASVVIWQCDAEGHYSEYAGQPGGYDGSGATYLRGVQVTDATGQVTFTTIYPGWYMGRATHIHAQVFVGGASKKVTQVAFPETISAMVYASGVYAAKGQNSATNATDMVFADGVQSELATVTGNTTSGYTAALTIGIAL